MEPKIWGKHAWLFLHTITLNYPDEPTLSDKQNYKSFFESLIDILPCPTCREHYEENIKNNPIQLNSKEDLVRWLIKIHNNVNERKNKPTLSYEEVINYYSKVNNNIKTLEKELIFKRDQLKKFQIVKLAILNDKKNRKNLPNNRLRNL